jgi:hypothetical protein
MGCTRRAGRRRAWWWATAGPLLALALAGCAAGDAAEPAVQQRPDTPPVVEQERDGGIMTRVDGTRCGDSTKALPGTAGGLVLDGSFPAAVEDTERGVFAGTVTLRSTRAELSGVTSPEVDVVVARAGQVVVEPLVKDAVGRSIALSPGDAVELAASGGLASCTGSGPLPPGSYEVHAVVVITRDDGPDVVVSGGPWPLSVP